MTRHEPNPSLPLYGAKRTFKKRFFRSISHTTPPKQRKREKVRESNPHFTIIVRWKCRKRFALMKRRNQRWEIVPWNPNTSNKAPTPWPQKRQATCFHVADNDALKKCKKYARKTWKRRQAWRLGMACMGSACRILMNRISCLFKLV